MVEFPYTATVCPGRLNDNTVLTARQNLSKTWML